MRQGPGAGGSQSGWSSRNQSELYRLQLERQVEAGPRIEHVPSGTSSLTTSALSVLHWPLHRSVHGINAPTATGGGNPALPNIHLLLRAEGPANL